MPVVEANDYTTTIELSNLAIDSNPQTYHYRVLLDGDVFIPTYEQTFRTFPGRSGTSLLEQKRVDIAIYADAAVSRTDGNASAYQNCPSDTILA